VWSPGRRRLTAGLVVTITLYASEALAVATVMPAIAEDLGRGGYGAAFSAFFLGSVVGVLFGGPSADRFGAARPYAAASVCFALGLVVSGTASAMTVLVAGRALQGLGAGATTPVVYAVIARAYPEAARLRMFAVISTAWVLPGVLGPGAAGLVAEHFGWRIVFLGLLPLVAVTAGATLPALVGLPRTPGSERSPLVPRGVAALAGRALRLRRGAPTAVALRGLLTCGFAGVDVFLPLAVTSVRDRSVLFASVAVTLTTLVWTVGSWLADRLVDRIGAVGLVRIGLAVVVVGIGLQLLLLAPSVPLLGGLAGTAIAGLGIGLAYSPLAAILLGETSSDQAGTASSGLSLFENLGFAAGPAITGALLGLGERRAWSDAQSLAVGWTAAGGVMLVALAASLRLSRPGPTGDRRDPARATPGRGLSGAAPPAAPAGAGPTRS
jgi:MFS family permease